MRQQLASIERVEEVWEDMPEDLTKIFTENKEAWEIAKRHMINWGDTSPKAFPTLRKPGVETVVAPIYLHCKLNDLALLPDGELVDANEITLDYSPMILAKKLQGYLQDNGKVLMPNGEFVDADRIEIKEKNFDSD